MVPLDLFGTGARFHHVALAVKELAAAGAVGPATTDPRQRVTVAFAELHGLPVEFVAPASGPSPVDENLRNGVKLIHLCYEVPDLQAALDNARRAGFHRVAGVTPAVAFGGRRITWVYHPVYGLFELLEARAGTTEQPEPLPTP